MPVDLYYVPGSSPVRSVRLVAAALGVPLNLKLVNLAAGEQLKPEFLKMNVQHTVPTMDDNGFYLSESRAIVSYLADKYGKDDKLYPKEAKARAFVNQRLYFDIGTLYQGLVAVYYPVIFAGASFDQSALSQVDQAFEYLNVYLNGEDYVAGKGLTIADLAIVATVSTYDALGYNFSKYKNVVRWYNHIRKVAPNYKEANEDGAKIFGDAYAPLLKK